MNRTAHLTILPSAEPGIHAGRIGAGAGPLLGARSRPRRGRRILLVDLDNLLGCDPTHAAPSTYHGAYRAFADAVGVRAGDIVIIGVPHAKAFIARDLAPSARLLLRSGRDGAELALLDELADVSFIGARFEEVIIGSGDHLFLSSVLALRGHGLKTTVVACAGQLSKRLGLAADDVVLLHAPASEQVPA